MFPGVLSNEKEFIDKYGSPKEEVVETPAAAEVEAVPAHLVETPEVIKVEEASAAPKEEAGTEAKKEDESVSEFRRLLTEEPAAEPADKVAPAVQVDPELSKKAELLDKITKDPLVDAILKWRETGGHDISEFVERLGVKPQNKTIEDYYLQSAKDLGLQGEELQEAVQEQMTSYEGMSKMDRIKVLNQFKESERLKADERVKSFSVDLGSEAEYQAKISREADIKLETEMKSMVGKKIMGLQIDEPIAQAIMRDAPIYAPMIFDAGKPIGYDVKAGIDIAFWKNYGKRVASESYKLGKSDGAEEVLLGRHRPELNSSSGNAAPIKSKDEAIKEATEAVTSKFFSKH